MIPYIKSVVLKIRGKIKNRKQKITDSYNTTTYNNYNLNTPSMETNFISPISNIDGSFDITFEIHTKTGIIKHGSEVVEITNKSHKMVAQKHDKINKKISCSWLDKKTNTQREEWFNENTIDIYKWQSPFGIENLQNKNPNRF